MAGLSLAEAAKLSGVTQATMRKWVSEIPGVQRLERGEYQIPKEALMGYLTGKQPTKLRGGVKGQQPVIDPPNTKGEVMALLREQLADLKADLHTKDREIGDLRIELREAHGEIRKLEAELRGHLSAGNGSISSTLSRWIKGR